MTRLVTIPKISIRSIYADTSNPLPIQVNKISSAKIKMNTEIGIVTKVSYLVVSLNNILSLSLSSLDLSSAATGAT